MVDIALDLGVTAHTLTTMVERTVDLNDRRAFRLMLTHARLDLIPQLQSELGEAAQAVAAPLGDHERENRVQLINRLIERG